MTPSSMVTKMFSKLLFETMASILYFGIGQKNSHLREHLGEIMLLLASLNALQTVL